MAETEIKWFDFFLKPLAFLRLHTANGEYGITTKMFCYGRLSCNHNEFIGVWKLTFSSYSNGCLSGAVAVVIFPPKLVEDDSAVKAMCLREA